MAKAKPDSNRRKPTAAKKRPPPTKQSRVLKLLQRPQGATIPELMEVTGWQSHSVRGFLAGTVKKKLGLALESSVDQGRGRVYKIEATRK